MLTFGISGPCACNYVSCRKEVWHIGKSHRLLSQYFHRVHSHRYNVDFLSPGLKVTLSKHILGQRIDTHSSEQTNLTGRLDPLPDLFVLFSLLTGLVDSVDIFVCELDVADGEVPSKTVGARRGGDEDSTAEDGKLVNSKTEARTNRSHSPLGSAPRQQDLFRRQPDSLGDGLHGLVDRSTSLAGQRDQTRISFKEDIVVVLEVNQRLGRGGDVRVVQD